MKELFNALSKFQGECPVIEFDAEVNVGGSYKFQYATLQQIIKTIKPVLAKNGLSIMQTGDSTIIAHSSGENIEIPFVHNFTKEPKNAQELGSMITYIRRYSLCAALGIVADEDDDANIACNNTIEKKEIRKENQKKVEKIFNLNDDLKKLLKELKLDTPNLLNYREELYIQSNKDKQTYYDNLLYLRQCVKKYNYDPVNLSLIIKELAKNYSLSWENLFKQIGK